MFEKMLEMMVSGVVGNFTFERIKALLSSQNGDIEPEEVTSQEKPQDSDIKEVCGPNIFYKNRYRTFDIIHDLYDVIELVKKPMVHIVIEDKSSSAWHLSLVVVEDLESREWYIFSKGQMAFEGSGGGLSNSRDLLSFLVARDIRFSGWVLDFVLSEKLSQGCLAWPAVRDQCIPLIAYNKNQYFVNYIIKMFGELSSTKRQ